MKIQYRKAKNEQDYQTISELANEIWPSTYSSILSKEQIHYMLNNFLSPQAIENKASDQYTFQIVEDSSNPIGFFSYKIYRNEIYLDKFYIKEDFQKKGIGSGIISYLEITYKKPQIRLNVNKNNIAEVAYQKMGFENVASEEKEIGHGFIADDHVFVKKRVLTDEERLKKDFDPSLLNPKPLKSILFSILGMLVAIGFIFLLYFKKFDNGTWFFFMFSLIPVLGFIGYKEGKYKKTVFPLVCSIVLVFLMSIGIYVLYYYLWGYANEITFIEMMQMKPGINDDLVYLNLGESFTVWDILKQSGNLRDLILDVVYSTVIGAIVSTLLHIFFLYPKKKRTKKMNS